MDTDQDGASIGRDESLSAYNKWLPVFFGSVNILDNGDLVSAIYLCDVSNNNTTTKSVIRGSITALSLTDCAVYSISPLYLEPYGENDGRLTDTVFMKNFSSDSEQRKFPRVLKDCVFMASLQTMNNDALVNSHIGNCYFHGWYQLTLPPSATVSGGIFRGETHLEGSVGVNPSSYNNTVHPPVFCNAVVDLVTREIDSNSIASPTVVTTVGDHGLLSGTKIKITTETGSSASIVGTHTITKITDSTFSIPVSNLPDGTFTISYGGNTTSSLNIATSTTAEVQTALRLIAGFGNCTVTGTSWVGNLLSTASYAINRVDFGAVTLPTLNKSITLGNVTITQTRAGTGSVSATFNLTRTISAGATNVNAEIVHELENSFLTQNISATSTYAQTSTSSIFAEIDNTSRQATGYSTTVGKVIINTALSGTAGVIAFGGGTYLQGVISGGYIAGSGIVCQGAISGGLFAVDSIATNGGISGSTAKFMGSVLTNSGAVTGGVIFSTGIVNTGTLSNGCTVYGTFTTKGTNAAKMPIDQIGIE